MLNFFDSLLLTNFFFFFDSLLNMMCGLFVSF